MAHEVTVGGELLPGTGHGDGREPGQGNQDRCCPSGHDLAAQDQDLQGRCDLAGQVGEQVAVDLPG